MIDHGVDDELGVLVALADALLDGAHVVAAQVGNQSRLTSHALQQLLLGVLAREAQADEVGRRQTAGALW